MTVDQYFMEQTFFAPYLPYVLLTLGIFTLVFAIFWESPKQHLKKTGIPVDGIVFDQEGDPAFDRSFDDDAPSQHRITIRFVTQKGEWITGVMKQGFQVFYTGQYKNGKKVKVYYDKDDPFNFYVDSKQTELTGRLVFGFTGLLFLLVGLYKVLNNSN